MHRLGEVSGGPAAAKRSPVLAGVQAPRVARPLRASAWTPAPRRTFEALIAGPLRNGTAIPLAIEGSMVSSLEVQPTREDGWDRCAIVRGFWDWRSVASSDWKVRRTGDW